MSAAGSPEFQNRTLVCSVLAIGIIEYSRKSAVEQERLKARFNALVSEALRGVAVDDRIILDTADGAAVSFIGDPEDALFVATSLWDLLENGAHGQNDRSFARMGINLGPVRLVRDINGQPNIVGDGIDVAQRLMTFAKPGQMLVSRSFCEVVSRLSEESAKLFSCEVAQSANDVREHEVYAVAPASRLRRRAEAILGDESRKSSGASARNGALAGLGRIFGRPAVASVIAVAVIIGTALFARDYRETHEPRSHSGAQDLVLTLDGVAGERIPTIATSGDLAWPCVAGHLS